MSAPNSRKRVAPGASPMVPPQQRMHQPFNADNLVNDPLLQWNAGEPSGFVDGSIPGANPYGLVPAQSAYSQGVSTPSNSLARRQMNQALVPTNTRANFDPSVEPWTGFGEDASLLQQNGGNDLVSQDNIKALEEMAQKAMRDAQGKRKPMSPFVQKLSSFLEEPKNKDLIRWSEKGDSFIVLDEDEFAKTLIPELFKHNNYASFVRQLNMYGFHKRVGLSDNSMRASERKNKSPSEYSNPFFRRGHPNLLWLINKPKTGKGGKHNRSKGAGGDGDSEEEPTYEEMPGPAPAASNIPTSKSLPSTDTQPLQKKEMTVIREELNKVREQQKLILGAINRLQRNNNELYNQALMFQSQHDRHQNSINAILNFLANVFRKTLEDQGNSQSVSDIISSMITNQGQQSAHQGSVVDLGDFFQTHMDSGNSMAGGPPKRARGLLPPIPNQENLRTSRSPSNASTPYHSAGNYRPESGQITELLDASPSESSPTLQQELENNPHERMMKIINDHNATNSSGMDLPEAAELVANAPSTLNNVQRSKLVDFMAGQSSSASSTPIPATSGPSRTATSRSPVPARSPPPTDGSAAAPSLSPIMRSPPMPTPSLHQISSNQDDLYNLQRLQSEQAAKISELSDMLGPLSPSGRIPGVGDGLDGSYFDPHNVDLDQYFDSNAFLNDDNFGGDGTDFNFNLDADGGQNAFGADRSGARDTPSPTGTEEIKREDLDVDEEADRDIKRRRMS